VNISTGRAAAVLLLSLAARDAAACATCQCGDYTLTLMGVEKPFAGRTRLALDAVNREEEQGDETLRDTTLYLSGSYSFNADFSVGLRLPFSRKSASDPSLAREEATGLGDADLALRYALGHVGAITDRHVWGLQGGLRMPTSREQKDHGVAVDIDAQPGTGAWTPSLGAWYGYFRYPSMVYASVIASEPGGGGYQGLDGGTAVVATVTAQRALSQTFSVQLGLESRYAKHNRFYGVEDPDSGGTAAFLVPGLVWSPAEDWVVHLEGQLPVVRNLNGDQHERGDIRVGVAFDLPN
jgi:hypothetical protein